MLSPTTNHLIWFFLLHLQVHVLSCPVRSAHPMQLTSCSGLAACLTHWEHCLRKAAGQRRALTVIMQCCFKLFFRTMGASRCSAGSLSAVPVCLCVHVWNPLIVMRVRVSKLKSAINFTCLAGGWFSMQVPAQRRGLHVTLVSLETCSDVPASNVFRTSNCWTCFDFRLLRVQVHHSPSACFIRMINYLGTLKAMLTSSL